MPFSQRRFRNCGRRITAFLEEFGVFLVYPDELHQVFDAEVGERHDAVVTDTEDPDEAVLWIHSVGDVP